VNGLSRQLVSRGASGQIRKEDIKFPPGFEEPIRDFDSASISDLLQHFNQVYPHLAYTNWESITIENAKPEVVDGLLLLAKSKNFVPYSGCTTCKKLGLV
jgi:hypothetical protein